MKFTSNVLMLFFVIALAPLSGHVIADDNLNDADTKETIKTIKVVYLAPQHPIYKQIIPGNSGSGGVISYGIDLGRLRSALLEMAPFKNLLGSRNMAEEVHKALVISFQNLSGARVEGIDLVSDREEFDIDEYIKSVQADELIVLRIDAAVSPGYEVLEFVAGADMYDISKKKKKKLYHGGAVYQSKLYGKYKTFADGDFKETIIQINKTYKDSIEKNSKKDNLQKARRWRSFAIAGLRENETITLGETNHDGEKWLKDDGALFLSMINEGVQGISALIVQELNNRQRPNIDLIDLAGVIVFQRQDIGSSVSMGAVYELESTPDRRVMRFATNEPEDILLSIPRETTPMFDLKGRYISDLSNKPPKTKKGAKKRSN
jgi:hypothetical protein